MSVPLGNGVLWLQWGLRSLRGWGPPVGLALSWGAAGRGVGGLQAPRNLALFSQEFLV